MSDGRSHIIYLAEQGVEFHLGGVLEGISYSKKDVD